MIEEPTPPPSMTWRHFIGPFRLVGIHPNTPINNTSHSRSFFSLFLSLSLSPSVFFSLHNFPNFSTTLSLLLLKLPHSHPAMHDLPYECNFDI
ncbi:hypothetical protein VNO80_17773 [Phaseolus coccineus]|uniref:Uncharacterized protein n=1 Tax=Phaseolus coccineus TaxID=3886 RepID=A0AAN9R374_PHACN